MMISWIAFILAFLGALCITKADTKWLCRGLVLYLISGALWAIYSIMEGIYPLLMTSIMYFIFEAIALYKWYSKENINIIPDFLFKTKEKHSNLGSSVEEFLGEGDINLSHDELCKRLMKNTVKREFKPLTLKDLESYNKTTLDFEHDEEV